MLWNRLHGGWKLLTLDGQDALLLCKGELGISVFAVERQRSTVKDWMGTQDFSLGCLSCRRN